MPITISIDDKLYQQALDFADPGMVDKDFVQEVFETFIRVRAAKRLSDLGGSMPDMNEVPRRRTDSD